MRKTSWFGMVLFTGMLLYAGNASADPECKTAYGTTVCGYHCTAQYGQVQCAKTPQGACMAAYGQIECWDPSERTRRPAECIAEYGQIACGYDCKANYGKVQCAQTPSGACGSGYGQLICWDPKVRTHTRAMCIASYGKVVCGFHCASGYGQIQCASTPNSFCRAENGSVTCYQM